MAFNSSGLSSAKAQKNLLQFGPNQIYKAAKISFFAIARHEVTEPMILLLFVVGFFYSIWGKWEDALTIIIVICLLVLAEVYNEFRAKKAITSLEKIAAIKTKVLRDGRVSEIDTEAVVPEDILILTPGTRISADGEVKIGVGLEIDESALTGESLPVRKNPGDNIYAGTVVTSGEGQAEVFTTGKSTRFGTIAETLREIRPPRTALQLDMKNLAGKLVYFAIFFSSLITAIGLLEGRNFKLMILTGLSLAFATIPEELPIVITMVLGLGSYALSKSKLLIKKLKAAETLGNATVIVTDKTGTITESKMTIVSFFPEADEKFILEKAAGSVSLFSVSPLDDEIRNKAIFDQAPPPGEILRQRNFDNKRKTRSVIRQNSGSYELFTSGAPEEIFPLCNKIDETAHAELDSETKKGRRVIAVAYKKLSKEKKELDFSLLEKGMDFAGLLSFEDPPRPGVRETILNAAKAGIRTIMVTGDHPETASYIAKEVGIETSTYLELDGYELDKLNEGPA